MGIGINMQQCDEITHIYERQAEECVRSVNLFYEEITELGRRSAYAPIVYFGNSIYRYYTEDMRRHLINQFQIWYEGSYSFHALMRAVGAGLAAEQNARHKMDAIRDYLEQIFHIQGEEIRVNTSEPKFENKDFELYREYLNRCVRSFESAMNDAKSSISAMAQGNDVVLLIGDIVKTTGQTLSDSFTEMIRQVTRGEEFAQDGRNFTLDTIRGTGVTMDSSITYKTGLELNI